LCVPRIQIHDRQNADFRYGDRSKRDEDSRTQAGQDPINNETALQLHFILLMPVKAFRLFRVVAMTSMLWIIALLTLTLTRDMERLARNKPGTYFLKLSLVGSKEKARQIVGPAKRSDWQNALASELPLLKQDRDQAEETLRRRGVVIDSAYQDPSIP